MLSTSSATQIQADVFDGTNYTTVGYELFIVTFDI